MGKISISIPYRNDRVSAFLSGLFLAVMGFAGTVSMIPSLPGMRWSIWLVMVWYVFCTLAMFLFGVKNVLEALMLVHFAPEGIAVTLLGRHLRRYPVEKICHAYHWRSANINWIGISCVSREELISQRERKLRRRVFNRSSLDYKMTCSDWQAWFLKDQLRAERWKGKLLPLREDFLWMEFTPERKAILRTLYPQIGWAKTGNPVIAARREWEDKNECVFCRGLCRESGKLGIFLLCAVFVVPFVVAVFFLPWDPVLLMTSGALGALFMIVWFFERWEYDQVWLMPDGIRITRGKRELEFLPKEKIHTVLCAEYRVKSNVTRYLAVSTLTEEELAERVARKCRSRESRQMLWALGQLPQSSRLILAWNTRKWMAVGFYRVPNAQSFAYTPDRERILRQCYPDAVWIDLDYS